MRKSTTSVKNAADVMALTKQFTSPVSKMDVKIESNSPLVSNFMSVFKAAPIEEETETVEVRE
jgi:hypothetical protein